MLTNRFFRLDLNSMRFMFADDWTLVVQCKNFEEAQQILENDLKVIEEYFKNARLINPWKT